jgi:hypothetical protein
VPSTPSTNPAGSTAPNTAGSSHASAAISGWKSSHTDHVHVEMTQEAREVVDRLSVLLCKMNHHSVQGAGRRAACRCGSVEVLYG